MLFHITNYNIDSVCLTPVVDGVVNYQYSRGRNPFKDANSPNAKVVFVVRGRYDKITEVQRSGQIYEYVAYDGDKFYQIRWYLGYNKSYSGKLIETEFSDETMATVLTAIKKHVMEEH